MGDLVLIQTICDKLISVLGEDLLSVIAHQSQLFTDKDATQLLIVTKKTVAMSDILERLKAQPVVRRFFQHTPPLLMSEQEIGDACDVFPIEFLDILESQEVLYGKDLRDMVTSDAPALRLEIESNLRRNVVLLRKELFLSGMHTPKVLKASFRNVLVTLKSVLRLKLIPYEGKTTEEIFRLLEARFKVKSDVFIELSQRLSAPARRTHASDWQQLFHRYLHELVQLTEQVDVLSL